MKRIIPTILAAALMVSAGAAKAAEEWGIEGEEKETMWRRNDDGAKPGYADLEQGAEAIMTAGKVSCFLTGDIHTVWNVSDGVIPTCKNNHR